LYLKRISIQNMGPVDNLELELPFKNDLPIPVCLVGANGSGKSTVLSTIVNGMVVIKGVAFDDAEIEKGKFFRLGNQQFIKYGEHYYHTIVEFSDDISVEGWMLDRPRNKFESELKFCPAITSWSQIPESEDHHFDQFPNSNVNLAKIRNAFAGNCVLYFPPNRFEEPSWLNEDNLLANVKFEQRRNIRSLSERLIFSQRRVAATCDWLLNVVLDKLVAAQEVQSMSALGKSEKIIPKKQQLDDPNDLLIGAITSILKLVLADEQSEVSLSIGNRQNRQLGIVVNRSDGTSTTIANVFALSSGESSLFALFSSILFDFDRSGVEFTSLQEVKGIVVIDEIDTHLHLDLQRNILPKLLKLFEGVQFIITTHSPLFLLGLQDTFGSESVQVISLPDGNSINAEDFSELDSAYIGIKNTARHRQTIEQEVIKSRRPLLIVEGRSDEIILNTAWQKLFSSPIPFDIQAAGIEADLTKRNGNAEQLRRTIEFVATISERTIIGLFDNDREGNERFKGLHKNTFEDWSDNCEIRKHRTAKVWGILLPVAVGREAFVTANINYRHLVIEHYFSDELLSLHGMKGDKIMTTEVYEVCGDKIKFAEKSCDFDDVEFEGFRMLFSRLADISNEYSPQPGVVQSMANRLDLDLLDV
jgi:predicted ATP-binding protein involved in virulence